VVLVLGPDREPELERECDRRPVVGIALGDAPLDLLAMALVLACGLPFNRHDLEREQECQVAPGLPDHDRLGISFTSVEAADLATLEGLTQVLADKHTARDGQMGDWDGTYCHRCGDFRRMNLVALFWQERWAKGVIPTVHGPMSESATERPVPSLFVATCLQCESRLSLVVYQGPEGARLVALPETYGGLSTPNTPDGIKYYLDQAERANSVGALSAAIVMYRSALEHLLHEQGFTEGMVGKRLEALQNATNPPPWRDQLHPDYLKVVNALANAAVHANNGDVSQQEEIFREQLLREVRELFAELLDLVYERQAKTASRLARLQAAASSVQR
jgi:hypothetical protein